MVYNSQGERRNLGVQHVDPQFTPPTPPSHPVLSHNEAP